MTKPEYMTPDDWEREIRKKGLDLPPEYVPMRELGRVAIDPLEAMLKALDDSSD